MRVIPVDMGSDGCGRATRTRWVLEQILPTSDETGDLKAPPGVSWDPVADEEALTGTWLDPGGGSVLELRTDGSYTGLAGEAEVVDVGTWAADASSSLLTITSSADSATCREGERFVLSRLRVRDLGTLVLQGDLERNECDRPWTGGGWFLLSS